MLQVLYSSPLWRTSPRTIVALWISFVLFVATVGYLLGPKTILPGPSSEQVILRNVGEKLAAEHGIPATDTVLFILNFHSAKVDSPDAQLAIDDLITNLREIRRIKDKSPLFVRIQTTGRTWFSDEQEIFTSDDRQYLILRARTNVPVFEAEGEHENWRAAVEKWQAKFPAYSIRYLSSGSADDEIFELIKRDLDHSLIYTIPLTFFILIRAFGTFGAACVPLGVALISLIASLGIGAISSHLIGPISATADQLVVLLVLAVGVDYSLFIVSRVREELAGGAPFVDAVTRARESTGVAILWSGGIVALSLSGLFLMQDTVLSSMALVSIFALITTVIGSVLVLPSFLLLIPNVIRPTQISLESSDSLARVSVRRPLITLGIVLVPLMALSILSHEIVLGSSMERDILPKGMNSASTFDLLKSKFPAMAGSDLSLIIDWGTPGTLDHDESVSPFFDTLRESGQVRGPYEVDQSDDERVTRYRFLVAGSANDPANHLLLTQARAELVPKFLYPLGVKAYFSGNVPYVVDETNRYIHRTPWVFASVLCASMLFLLLAFRSLVVPIKAVLLNILSTTASFGVLVATFQFGIFHDLHYGVIEGFVPALLFAILFGLSMDYHVFILSRIQEEVRKGRTTNEAVLSGVAATGPIITYAALIMASVFLVIACLELPVIKQLGVGLAVAVILDATVIRSVLLPASMVLLGRRNWYFPSWLKWLPNIGPRE